MRLGRHRVASGTEGSIGLHLPAQLIEEPKGRVREGRVIGCHRVCDRSQQRSSPSRVESIDDDVGSAQAKLDPEIIPK
jgi:hypothetical protein